MYLDKFPKFKYKFNNTDYDIVDIFRRIAFSQNTLEDTSVFYNYYVVDDDTPENIALRLYGSYDLWWLVLLPNNVIQNNELPISENKLLEYINNKYTGKVLFFNEYMPDLKAGDVIAGITLDNNGDISETSQDNYAVISEYNKIFRYAKVNSINGIISEGMTLGFYDSNSNELNINYITSLGGEIKKKPWAIVRLIKDHKDAPVEFKNDNLNYRSPYYINDLYEAKSSAIGSYDTNDLDDTNTIYNTSLYKFINGISTTSIAAIETFSSKEIKDNQKYRIIKILNPKFFNIVLSEIFNLINSSNKRSIITVNI